MANKLPDYVEGSNRPRPTKAKYDNETIEEYIERCYKEGKIIYENGRVLKCYDFRGDGSWLDVPKFTGAKTGRGYINIGIRFNGTYRQVGEHRIVYIMFNGSNVFDEGLVINHKNGVKDDNRIENLELVTQSYNIKHSLQTGLRNIENTNTAKLDWGKVKEVREMYNSGKYYQKEIAEIYGVSQTTISSIVINKTWKDEHY